MTCKVLVTGGAGFVGSHLVDALIEKGHEVTVMDNLDPQVHPGGAEPEWLNPGIKSFRKTDVARVFWGTGTTNVLKGFDAVFHLAAAVGVGQSMYDVGHYARTNVMGTASLLDALVNTDHNVKKLVVASSMSIYGEGKYACPGCGESPGVPLRNEEQMARDVWEHICPLCGYHALRPVPTDERHPLRPTSVYAITKRDQEEMCLTVGKARGIKTVALRYFNIYGPRQSLSNPYTGVCAIFQQRIKAGHPPVIYEDGFQRRDFTSVHDITRANMLALEKNAMNGEAFNVGTGIGTPIIQVAGILLEHYKSDVGVQIANKYRAGDIRHCYADITKIRRHGYEPRVQLKDGLAELCQWGEKQESHDKFDIAEKRLKDKGLVK